MVGNLTSRTAVQQPALPPAPLPAAEPDPAWFAILVGVGPFALDHVERFAATLGISTFAPREKHLSKVKIRRHGQQGWERRIKLVPLLDRYAFVRLPADGSGFRSLTTPAARWAGVSSFVGSKENGPRMFPAAIVEDLRQREAAGEFDRTVKRAGKRSQRLPEWAVPGSTVAVISGPFAGFEGVIEEALGDQRVRVGIRLLGRVTSLAIDLASLEATTKVNRH